MSRWLKLDPGGGGSTYKRYFYMFVYFFVTFFYRVCSLQFLWISAYVVCQGVA